jgi:hypothetical protein
MGPVAAVIGAVATVGGTIMAYSAQKKAAKAAQRQQELSTQRSNRQAIREAQLKRAQAIAAGASMGALGGSALAGGLGSLGAQLGSGLGFSSQMSGLSADINKYSQKAETWGAVASMGGSLFQAAGGFSAFSGKADTAGKAPTSPGAGAKWANPNLFSFGGGR